MAQHANIANWLSLSAVAVSVLATSFTYHQSQQQAEDRARQLLNEAVIGHSKLMQRLRDTPCLRGRLSNMVCADKDHPSNTGLSSDPCGGLPGTSTQFDCYPMIIAAYEAYKIDEDNIRNIGLGKMVLEMGTPYGSDGTQCLEATGDKGFSELCQSISKENTYRQKFALLRLYEPL